ncbi:MAG: P-type conjugative transfer protein TrbL [Rhodobacteraceae bacterium]|nr:P-type conjugative transfer protein TrbL [Paracoccaceae bacterium]
MPCLLRPHALVAAIGATIGIVLLLAGMASAQTPAAGVLDDMIDQMNRRAGTMTVGVVSAATSLLYAMAAIEMAWSFARGAIQGEGLPALLTRLVTRFVVVGIFVLCLQFGPDLVRLAIDSALAVARAGGSTAEPSPSGVLSQALRLVGQLIGNLSVWTPGYSLGLVLVAMMVAVTAAAMAAIIVLVYAELYLMAVAGLLALGFGGLEMTRDIAVTYIRMLVGKGFKLLTLLMVNGLVMATLDATFTANAEHDLFAAIQILIVQVVGLVLILQLPSAVESLTGGAGINPAAALAGGLAGATAGRAMLAAARTGGGAAYGAARGGVMAARTTSTGGGLTDMAAAATGTGMAAKAGSIMKGAGTGAARGAVAGFSGQGTGSKIASDIIQYLDRKQ